MRAFKTLTKGEQVLSALRKTIKKNAAATELPLKGVRELAREYNVSPRTVVIALDRLEEEHLIRREQGKGTFVRPAQTSRGRDITLLLTYKTGQTLNPYPENFLRIAQAPYRRSGYNFTVRLVELVQPGAFIIELKRLLGPLHSDALLICAPSLSLEEIEICLHLETPVIFLGDFACDVPENLPYNQVTGDNYYIGAESIKRLHEERHLRELILISGPQDRFYYRDFTRGAMEKAAELGIVLNRIEPENIRSGCFSAFNKDAPILSAISLPDNVMKNIPKNRNLYHYRVQEQANIPFFNAVYDRFEQLTDFRRINLKLEFELELIRR